jgi:hypothetical protein
MSATVLPSNSDSRDEQKKKEKNLTRLHILSSHRESLAMNSVLRTGDGWLAKGATEGN